MHEAGRGPQGPNYPNTRSRSCPRRSVFPVPVTLFTNGWVHVLEDSEIAFILMMAAACHGMGGLPVVSRRRAACCGWDAARRYEAHMMLSRLGLVTVSPDGRRAYGTIEDSTRGPGTSPRAQLHPGRLRPRRAHHAQRRDRPPARTCLLAAETHHRPLGIATMAEWPPCPERPWLAARRVRDRSWRASNAVPGEREQGERPLVVKAAAAAIGAVAGGRNGRCDGRRWPHAGVMSSSGGPNGAG